MRQSAAPSVRAAAVAAVLLLAAACTSSQEPAPTESTGAPVPNRTTPAPAPSHVAPEPGPTSTAPTPSLPALDTTGWATYESQRYDFTIGYPADWTVEPATGDWELAHANDWLSPSQEMFLSPDEDVRVHAWSVQAGVDETYAGVAEWVGAYCEVGGCRVFPDNVVELCNERWDCHPGLLVAFDSVTQAFFTGGNHQGRMVVVAAWRPDGSLDHDGTLRQLLEAFLSTMDVCTARPEGPLGPPSGCLKDAPALG